MVYFVILCHQSVTLSKVQEGLFCCTSGKIKAVSMDTLHNACINDNFQKRLHLRICRPRSDWSINYT